MANTQNVVGFTCCIAAMLMTFCNVVRGDEFFECMCNCVPPADSSAACPNLRPPNIMNMPKTVSFSIHQNQVADRCQPGSLDIPRCSPSAATNVGLQACSRNTTMCCWQNGENLVEIRCRRGNHETCTNICSDAVLRDCICEKSPPIDTTEPPGDMTEPSDDMTGPSGDGSENGSSEKQQNVFNVGLAAGAGAGVGVCVLLAAVIGLLIYCRIQGRREGKKSAESHVTDKNRSDNNFHINDNSEEYAEIDGHVYAGERTIRATAAVNPGYNTSVDVVSTPNQEYTTLHKPDISAITPVYRSLKKPNQDMGSGEYTDPEKYTDAPALPSRSSNVKDEEEDEDYVSQGTPDGISGEGDRDYFTLEPTNTSNTDNTKYESAEDREYFTLEPQKSPDDYVDVDGKE